MPDSERQLCEIDLECGDTVSSRVEPRIGSYRVCIHCGSRKKVKAVRHPIQEAVQAALNPQPPLASLLDVSYGYSSAYGYAAQQLDFIKARCDSILRNDTGWIPDLLLPDLFAIRDMAQRGIRESSDAIQRYAARIESIESGTRH